MLITDYDNIYELINSKDQRGSKMFRESDVKNAITENRMDFSNNLNLVSKIVLSDMLYTYK